MLQLSNDKSSLAKLAIPVLLSLILGLSVNFDTIALAEYDSTRMDSTSEEMRGADDRKNSRKVKNAQNQHSKSEQSLKIKNKLRLAIESNDYQAFLASVAGTPFAEIINEEAFAELVNEHARHTHYYSNNGFD